VLGCIFIPEPPVAKEVLAGEVNAKRHCLPGDNRVPSLLNLRVDYAGRLECDGWRRPTVIENPVLAMLVRPEGRHLIAIQVSHNLPADACS
jgi:hypothetical protein